ncbi:uncharacterized protein LOC143290523 [Babylonia areolata]|uniref:uncharacterized protein LOC143290523 n=1 Tax=Babylonia areolata TaxID=304850 RepID=UPI003FD64B43
MASRAKPTSRPHSDWTVHMFSDSQSDEDDGLSFDNPATDYRDVKDSSDVEKENSNSSQPTAMGRTHAPHDHDKDSVSSVHSQTGQHTSLVGGEHDGREGSLPSVDVEVIALCRDSQKVDVGQVGYGVCLPDIGGGGGGGARASAAEGIMTTAAPSSRDHSSPDTAPGSHHHDHHHHHHHQKHRTDMDHHHHHHQQLTGHTEPHVIIRGRSDPPHSSDNSSSTESFDMQDVLHGSQTTPTLSPSRHSPSPTTSSSSPTSRKGGPGSRQPFIELNVHSLGSGKTGESIHYLPADNSAQPSKAEKKPSAKRWDKLRAMLRRKSKDSPGFASVLDSERATEEKDKAKKQKKQEQKKKGGTMLGAGLPWARRKSAARDEDDDEDDDVYTVDSQVLPLPHAGSYSSLLDLPAEARPQDLGGRVRSPCASPITLRRRTPDYSHLTTLRLAELPDSPPPPSPFRSASPLMHLVFAGLGALDDDALSDTSSLASFSLENVAGSRDSNRSTGGGGRGGGGGGGGKKAVGGKGKGGTAEQTTKGGGGGGGGYQVKFHTDSNPTSAERRASASLAPPGTSARSLNLNEVAHSKFKGPYGKLFTAKLFNCIGQKAGLSNVTHVSHVYKGTLLVTNVLGGKLLHLARSGRLMKSFEVEQGSEPWSACITPLGHVAVTLRWPACVTVWSGNGTLVQEFGFDVLQSPSGLACDHQGRFIVTDERTNRVSIFSPDGQFLRYLTHMPPPKQIERPVSNHHHHHNNNNSSSSNNNNNNEISEKGTSLSNDKTDAQETSVGGKTKKRVRINVDCPEICIIDPAENIVQAEDGTKPPKTAGQFDTGDVSSSPADDTAAAAYSFSSPRYVCVSATGHIVVSDSGSNSVKVFSPEGVFLHSFGASGSKDGQLKVPYGVCCDQDNQVYVADHYNDRISVFSIQGEFLQHALTAVSGLSRPKSVAIQRAHVRKLFVAHGGLRSTEILVYTLESTPRSISFQCDL